jgi:hypothetical protein
MLRLLFSNLFKAARIVENDRVGEFQQRLNAPKVYNASETSVFARDS